MLGGPSQALEGQIQAVGGPSQVMGGQGQTLEHLSPAQGGLSQAKEGPSQAQALRNPIQTLEDLNHAQAQEGSTQALA